MKIHLYAFCWNDADMLGFFFRHYDEIVDHYVIYDDGSSDGSLELLRAHPKVELRHFHRIDQNSLVLSANILSNQVWKESRGKADWVIVTSIDEHLTKKGSNLKLYLKDCQRSGVTLVPAIGFQMFTEEFPADGEHLSETRLLGAPSNSMNKLNIFDPNAISETCFSVGRHLAKPSGTLRYPDKDEVMLLHYKYLGFERTFARQQALGRRLQRVDIDRGYGYHWRLSREEFAESWGESWAAIRSRAIDLSHPNFDCSKNYAAPLWWRGPPTIEPSRWAKLRLLSARRVVARLRGRI